MTCGSFNVDDPDRPRWSNETVLIAQYDYHNADGAYAYTVRRGRNPNGTKSFVVGRRNMLRFGDRIGPEDQRDWFPGLNGKVPVLYRFPQLIADTRIPGTRVLIPEGEKDVDTAVALGCVATSNPFGALKWKRRYSFYLKGTDAVIIADKDERGHQHATQVAHSIKPYAARVRIVTMPDPFKDLTEWKDARGKAGLSIEDIKSELHAWLATT